MASRPRQQRIVRALARACAVVALGCAAWLSVDHLAGGSRNDAGIARTVELEQQTAADAAVSETLHAERERLTDTSLRREGYQLALAWTLLVSLAGFLAAA